MASPTDEGNPARMAQHTCARQVDWKAEQALVPVLERFRALPDGGFCQQRLIKPQYQLQSNLQIGHKYGVQLRVIRRI